MSSQGEFLYLVNNMPMHVIESLFSFNYGKHFFPRTIGLQVCFIFCVLLWKNSLIRIYLDLYGLKSAIQLRSW